MTERSDSDLEQRLRTYFHREVERALRDLSLHPAIEPRRRSIRPEALFAGLAALLMIAVAWIAVAWIAVAIGPTTTLPSPSAPVVVAASPTVSGTPRSIGGGCGDWTVYAPPGPSEIPGLQDLPWAPASPATLTAYFFTGHAGAPFLSAGDTRPDGGANKVLWVGGGGATLRITAKRVDGPAAIMNFAFPASGGAYPSIINLPTEGCWLLDLETSGGTSALIELQVGPNVEQSSPTGEPTPTADPLAALRRPFRTPALGSAGECPATPIGRTIVYGAITYASGATASGVNQLQGQGPVYVGWLDESTIAGLQADAQGWYGNKFLLAVDGREYGPILLRGERLDRPGPVAFNDDQPELLVGNGASGTGPPVAPAGSRPPISRVYVLGFEFRDAGCYVIQADGATSSTTIVFRIEPETVPAAQSLHAGAQTLLARPFAPAQTSGACPVGPTSSRSGFARATGDGTVFLAGGSEAGASAAPDRSGQLAIEARMVWVNTDPAARPALIRAARIDGTGTVAFSGGVDTDDSYLLLAGDSGVSSPGVPVDWQQWPTTTTFSTPGCYEFQVDGVDFTESLFVHVTG